MQLVLSNNRCPGLFVSAKALSSDWDFSYFLESLPSKIRIPRTEYMKDMTWQCVTFKCHSRISVFGWISHSSKWSLAELTQGDLRWRPRVSAVLPSVTPLLWLKGPTHERGAGKGAEKKTHLKFWFWWLHVQPWWLHFNTHINSKALQFGKRMFDGWKWF